MMTNFIIITMLFDVFTRFGFFVVDGDSMLPNLFPGQVILIDKKVDVKRGDIVIFSFDNDYYYVKRVIGLPNEIIKIYQKDVYLRSDDGVFRSLNEEYLKNSIEYGDERFFRVPENEYFVLGDNRNFSQDSRFFVYPYVKNDNILGKYVF